MSHQGVNALESALQLAIDRHQQGDIPAAEALYGQILLANPRQPVCLHNLGLIRMDRSDVSAALDLLEAAVREAPVNPLFRSSLAIARQAAGDTAGAILQLRKALDIDPRQRQSRLRLGNLLRDLGRLDEAEQLLTQGLELNPLDPDLAVQSGVLRLLRRDDSGWTYYAWHHWSPEWLKLDRPVLVPLPQWDGQPCDDAGLLLYGEQGIGDEIMFSLLVPTAARRAVRTGLLCEPRLVPLLARSFPGVRVEPRPDHDQSAVLHADASFQQRCSLTRLAGVLGVNGPEDPAPVLRADPEAARLWRGALAALGGSLRVGLSWRGGAVDRTRTARSIPLADLAPLFEVPGVRIIDIQYGDHAREINEFNAGTPHRLVSLEGVDPLRDMDGFAALLSALDLVICVDNSTAHLAGALGVPVWMLCPAVPNWRWGLEGDTCRWYRTLRLFRQQQQDEKPSWMPVIAAIADSLAVQTAAATPPSADEMRTTVAVTRRSDAICTRPSALLINDTTWWYHWGCACTSLAVHAGLRAKGHAVASVPIQAVNALLEVPASVEGLEDEKLYQRFAARHATLLAQMESVSEVIINGEGSIHGMGHTARALLWLAYVAKKKLGKRTAIINHSCFPGDHNFYSMVYRELDFVAVREAGSAALLGQLGVETTTAFDCLPLFVQQHPQVRPASQRRILLAGSVLQSPQLVQMLATIAGHVAEQGFTVEFLTGAGAYLARDDVELVARLQPLLRGRYQLMAATSEQQWLQAIAGADLLVSGRFHHSIAAACLGTPFLVTASNTPKIAGMLDQLGFATDQVWIEPGNSTSALAKVDRLLSQPAAGRIGDGGLARLCELAWRNFGGLLQR